MHDIHFYVLDVVHKYIGETLIAGIPVETSLGAGEYLAHAQRVDSTSISSSTGLLIIL